jgi:hypothetical protein
MYRNVYELITERASISILNGSFATRKQILEGVKNNIRGHYYYMHPRLTFGQHYESVAKERSNVRVFLKKYEGSESLVHIKGLDGFETVGVDILCTSQSIIKCLQKLTTTDVIDEGDYYRMECEIKAAAWESHIKADFIRAIQEKFKAYCNPDENQLLQLYYHLQEKTGTYPVIGPGGLVSINIGALLKGLPHPPAFLNLENSVKPL